MNWLKYRNTVLLIISFLLMAAFSLGYEYQQYIEGNISLEVHTFSKEKTLLIHGQRVTVGEIGSVNYQADSFLQILIYKDIKLILNCLSVIVILIYAYHFILKKGDRIREAHFLKNRVSGGIVLYLITFIAKMYAFRWVENNFYENNLGALKLDLHVEFYSSIILLSLVSLGVNFLIDNYRIVKK